MLENDSLNSKQPLTILNVYLKKNLSIAGFLPERKNFPVKKKRTLSSSYCSH